MNLKRLTSAGLALTMAATLAPMALCADLPAGWTPADGARIATPEVVDVPLAETYRAQLFLNGEAVEIPAEPVVPGAPAKMIPMRVLCEADGGYADWFQEDEQGFFFLADSRFIVNFSDLSVELDGEVLEDVTAYLSKGVTFLPAEVVALAEGVEVDLNIELDVDRIDVSTPNGSPLMKLANTLMETAEIGATMKTSPAEMEEIYGEALGFKAEFVTEGVAFLPMMTTPDTLMLGKVAEGKTDELKAVLDAYCDSQKETFSWYLSDNLPKVENAQFVTEGDWFMFLISENADEVVEQFKTAVAEME